MMAMPKIGSGMTGALRSVGLGLAMLGLLASLPARAIEIIDSTGGEIYIEVNKGRLIRLDQAPATVFLANSEIADLQIRSSRMVYVFGRQTGETSLFALDKKDEILLNRKIIVGYDLAQLGAAIDKLIPNSGITLSMVNTTLVVDGTVGTPSEAAQVMGLVEAYVTGGAGSGGGRGGGGALAMLFGGDSGGQSSSGKVLNRLKVSMPTQVNLRVTIAEVSRASLKRLGVDFNATGGIGFFRPTVNPTLIESAGTAAISKRLGNGSVAPVLEALETEGLASVLAAPNLTAISGQTATFLVGGELPIFVPESKTTASNPDGTSASQGSSGTVEFKPYGVSLAFTPTVMSDARVSLKVAPEVSEKQEGGGIVITGVQIPALNVRRASTTVEMGDGESMVIGGLLQNNSRNDVTKFPGLADLPILGALFRSDRYRRNETELIIVVTPILVRPTKDRIPLPTDGYQAATDTDRLVWGNFYRDSTGPMPDRIAHTSGVNLVGPVGFVVE